MSFLSISDALLLVLGTKPEEADLLWRKIANQGFTREDDARGAFLQLDVADITPALNAKEKAMIKAAKAAVIDLIEKPQERRAAAEGAGAVVQQQASPAQTDVMVAFMRKLEARNIDRPKSEVLERVRCYYAQDVLLAAAPSVPPDDALRIYEMAENMPGQTTRCQIVNDLHIVLNGPWLNRAGWILSGVHLDSGHLLAVKLLPTHELHQRGAATAEVAAVELLGSPWETGIPIVPMEVVEVHVPKKDAKTVRIGAGLRQAIQMPLYPSDLAGLPQLNERLILAGTRRMITALDYVHGKGIVHMDVKADNVLVNGKGEWYLTDFGCATGKDQPIRNYTEVWYPENLMGQPSDPKHDFGMLLVLVAAVLAKEHLAELKAGSEETYNVTFMGLQQRLANIELDDLKELVRRLCYRAGWDTKLNL